MGVYVAELFKAMLKKQIKVVGARVLVLGLTFKENCPDLRNTRVIDVVRELEDYEIQVGIYDPWADTDQAHDEFGLNLYKPLNSNYDGIVLAVAHEEFKSVALRQYAVLEK